MRVLGFLGVLALVGLVTLPLAAPADARGITVAPFTFAARGLGSFVPSVGPPAESKWVKEADGNWKLLLAKNVPLSEVAAGGAQINGVAGLSTTGLTLGFAVDGYCGAGAPRFNLRLQGVPGIVFLGCNYGNSGGTVTFTPGTTYGGILYPSGQPIESLSIIFDEQGTTKLDNIQVGADIVGGPSDSGGQ